MKHHFSLPRKNRSENGVTAVETAITLALLLLIFIGIIEFSVLMTSRANMKAAVNAAVRAGSIASNSADTDYVILNELRADLSGRVEAVEYVIIFNANNVVNSQPSSSCLGMAANGGTGVTSQCNIYSQSILKTPNASSFGYDPATNPTAISDIHWPALTRSATYSGGRDLLGVYIASKSKSITGLVPKLSMQTTSVLRIEAQDV